MARYSRLYAKAGENPDIGDLLEANPVVVSLWFLAIARADLYGILPAEPRRFRAAVAPAASLPPDTVEIALDEMEARGWIRRYEDGEGNALLHILKYHELQEVRWANGIGPPDHDLPPWWEPTAVFVEVLAGKNLGRVRSQEHRRKWSELQERYCTPATVLPENNATQDTRHNPPPPGRRAATPPQRSVPPADGNGQEEEFGGEVRSTANGHGPSTAHGQEDGPGAEGRGANAHSDKPDIRAAIAALAAACRTRTNHPGIRAAVEDQLAQGRDPAFLRHTAIITQTEFADNPKTTPGRVAAYFATCCSNGAPAWERNKPDAWERVNGPPPPRDPARAIYLAEKQAWKEGRRPRPEFGSKYIFPESPS